MKPTSSKPARKSCLQGVEKKRGPKKGVMFHRFPDGEWTSFVEGERVKCVPKLTEKVLMKAYLELNNYKQREMPVHEESKKNTKLHLQPTSRSIERKELVSRKVAEENEKLAIQNAEYEEWLMSESSCPSLDVAFTEEVVASNDEDVISDSDQEDDVLDTAFMEL